MKGFKPSKVKFKQDKKPIGNGLGNKKILTIVGIAVAVVIVLVAAILIINSIHVGNQIHHIHISARPNDTEYFLNEELDLTGLTVQIVLNNGSSYFVESDKVTVTGFNNKKVNDKLELTVHYKEFTDTFTVSVISFPKPDPNLDYIEVKGYKETYTWAEWQSNWLILDDTYILCHFDDESTHRESLTTSRILEGLAEINGPGTYTLKVYYDQYSTGIVRYAEFTITINP